jgi:hypothetical protein
MARVDILGIRHHGPGSARSLRAALTELAPDRILIEGPPEASPIMGLAADPGMRPPVAILGYDPALPARSSFFPFAEFSPEWQAMRFAAEHRTEVRFADLPLGQMLALRGVVDEAPEADEGEPGPAEPPAGPQGDLTDDALRRDPLGALGRAIGEDGERWWDRLIEHRQGPGSEFEAVSLLMSELRAGLPPTRMDGLREAAMREAIRAAERDGAERIAFVCGAFHVPALLDREAEADDRAALAVLPSTSVETTWVPWSEAHLASASGYGAGVASPGWYGHLWSGPRPLVESWLVIVAQLLRGEGFDISPAHLIEASRLAETTAALRGRSTPGLDEVTEAIRAVLTFGSDVPLALIAERLIVGTALGAVPDTVRTAPLARDLAHEQRRLRLEPSTVERALDLDLRGDTDRDRSHLLHRLRILEVPWGTPAEDRRRAMGTFREPWSIRWDPMYAVALVTQSRWGNTIAEASAARLLDEAVSLDRLELVAARLEQSFRADLPEATAGLTARVGALAAVAADVTALLAALPALARSLRYGSVRAHDSVAVSGVVEAMLQRAIVGLPAAVGGLDDAGATEMVSHIEHGAEAVGILDRPELREMWAAGLSSVCDRAGVHGLLVGRCARLLLDDRQMAPDEAATRLSAALSAGAGPEYTMGYLDGFLAGSGTLLVHDTRLFRLVDEWLVEQTDEGFEGTLPYLRRTFARFTPAERRALRDRARQTAASPGSAVLSEGAPATSEPAPALDLLDSLLGFGDPGEGSQP